MCLYLAAMDLVQMNWVCNAGEKAHIRIDKIVTDIQFINRHVIAYNKGNAAGVIVAVLLLILNVTAPCCRGCFCFANTYMH